MITGFETLAVALLTLANTAPTLCEAGEQTVLYGQVQDDFGFDVAVCISGDEETPKLTIRWVGEGGGSEISCTSGDCDGRIEYSRYTSPHQTILTLGWMADGNKQILTQQFWRDDLDAQPAFNTTHRWYPEDLSWYTAHLGGYEAFPVNTSYDPLALMEVESVLEAKNGTHPLFGEAQ